MASVFDCDGVLTDGSLLYSDQGVEIKQFHVRDGFGFQAAMATGLKVGVLTGRSSRMVAQRMDELGVELYMHGQNNKAVGIETLAQRGGDKRDSLGFRVTLVNLFHDGKVMGNWGMMRGCNELLMMAL